MYDDTDDINDDVRFSTNVDDSLYYACEYQYGIDNCTYYDTHESHVYQSSNSDVKGDHTKASQAPISVDTKEPDYNKQRPLFAWLPTDIIKKTYELTTQYARIPMITLLSKRYMSPNPACNVHRRDEPVATDTVFADTPAVDCGVTSAQFFVGCKSMVRPISSQIE